LAPVRKSGAGWCESFFQSAAAFCWGSWATPAVWPVVAVLVVSLGVLATVVTGEAAISWAFVLIDIPMVAVSASVGFLVAHRLRRGGWRRGEEEHEAQGR
jgi:hypothetical protein